MNSQRKKAIVPIFIGLIGFISVTRRPRFELMHTVDVVQLIATGMCFGVALALIMARFRGQS